MSNETALQPPAVKSYHETMNEILSIQQAAMMIHTNGIAHKISVHKTPVDQITFIHLSAYFSARIQPADQHIKTQYLVIDTVCSNIFVPLKES